MTEPTKPASGSDPKTGEKEVEKVIREYDIWLPISEAPKTGEHILVTTVNSVGQWGHCRPDIRQSAFAVVHWWNNPGEEGWCLSLGGGDYFNDPTHFQYLREVFERNIHDEMLLACNGLGLPWPWPKTSLPQLLAAYASSREAANEKLIGELVETLNGGVELVTRAFTHVSHGRSTLVEAQVWRDQSSELLLLARARGGQKK